MNESFPKHEPATRAVQYFTDEQLEHGQSLTPEQITQFLEDFRKLHAGNRQAPDSGQDKTSPAQQADEPQ